MLPRIKFYFDKYTLERNIALDPLALKRTSPPDLWVLVLGKIIILSIL